MATANTILYQNISYASLPPIASHSELTIETYTWRPSSSSENTKAVYVITAVDFSGNPTTEISFPTIDSEGHKLYLSTLAFSSGNSKWGNITKVSIPNDIYNNQSGNDLVFPTNITTVMFPNGIPSTCYYAYNFVENLSSKFLILNCVNVSSIIVPINYHMTENNLYFRDSSLFNENVANILKDCVSLKPNGAGDDLFRGLKQPSIITIDLSNLIQFNASFQYSNNIYIKLSQESLIPLNQSWYISGNSSCRVYVPDNLVDSYKSAANWSEHSSQIYPISELEE